MGSFLEFGSEQVADQDAADADDEGDDADDQGCLDDVDRKEGEGDADRQRVDAGGNGEDEEFLYVQVFQLLLLLPLFARALMQAFPDHLAADEGQQDKGDPVVDGGDVGLELHAEKIAGHRHQELEPPEEEGDDKSPSPGKLFHRQALDHRDGEGVHRQADPESDKCNNAHRCSCPKKRGARAPLRFE